MNRTNTLIASLLVITFGLVSTPAQAFFIEPYVGYETGEFDPNGSAPFDVAGPSYGLRLGFSFLGFRLGAEYGASTLKGKQYTTDYKFEPTDMGLYVGYEFPVMVKVWAVYSPSASSKISQDGVTSPFDFEDGVTTKFGVAYTGFLFDFGLEKINRHYEKQVTEAGSYDLDTMGAFLMFSFP